MSLDSDRHGGDLAFFLFTKGHPVPPQEMSKHRVLAEFGSIQDAKKVEETVKTGYAETTLEAITHWMAVEEDLVSSYESLAGKPEYASNRVTLEELARESKEAVAALAELRRSVEKMDGVQVRRIEKLEKLSSRS